MAKSLTNELTAKSVNEELLSKLLTTLEETVFFGKLTKHIKSIIKCDEILVNLVHEDNSIRLIAKNGKPVKKAKRITKGLGAAGYVIKSKKAYFTNNVARDPIFSVTDNGDTVAELCVPISVDGVIIGTMHFKRNNEEVKFERSDINSVLSIFKELEGPLANMKMYLSAKFLNESLQMKIKEKDEELKVKKVGLQLIDTYKVQDKNIIGNSKVMKDLLSTVERVAQADVNVLVNGESGVGKEMIARRIHCRSSRGESAFVQIDCSMGTEDQLETELFGREDLDVIKGLKIHKGIIEAGDGGTIFVNNIHKLPVRLQAKLVSFLKEGIFFRAGTQAPLRSNVRIIASTSKNISELVAEGTFREDLFFQVSTMHLRVPSLRERFEDIEVLANFFLNNGKEVEKQKSMSPGVINLLMDYSWPGNVRELQSIMERAFILSPSSIVEREHLADSIRVDRVEKKEEVKEAIGFQEMTLNDLEKEHITRTLEHLGGNKTKTAKVLGITVKTLYNKLHSYGMIMNKEA